MENITEIIQHAIDARILKKIVLSRSKDKYTVKAVGTLFEKSGSLFLQLECFCADGKALHKNIPYDFAAAEIARMLESSEYHQGDIITTGGNCTVMVSSGGNIHVKNNIKAAVIEKAEIRGHNSEKNYILSEQSAYKFLRELDVCDQNGRIYDKKQAKYRQVNRFLELLADVYENLPPEGELCVCDLCCGKSYLTFAVYWYLTEKKRRAVTLYGVDLKPDVIAYCGQTAKKLGYDGLHFLCGDALEFVPPQKPSLVISLHACDIATDIVLAGAVKAGADVILSTPCCHHELSGQIRSDALDFITRYPILKQKLCDAATDGLRAMRLEAEGYDVTALELIDPDETPKNVMLRAVKIHGGKKNPKALEQYRTVCRFLNAEPYLDKLL